MGSSDNVAFENQIVINGVDEKYAIYLYRGSDEPMVAGSDGRPRRNHIYNNSLMSDDAVVMMREADDNTLEVIFRALFRRWTKPFHAWTRPFHACRFSLPPLFLNPGPMLYMSLD